MNGLRLMIADNSTKEVEVIETETVQNVTIENDFSNVTLLNGTTSGTDGPLLNIRLKIKGIPVGFLLISSRSPNFYTSVKSDRKECNRRNFELD